MNQVKVSGAGTAIGSRPRLLSRLPSKPIDSRRVAAATAVTDRQAKEGGFTSGLEERQSLADALAATIAGWVAQDQAALLLEPVQAGRLRTAARQGAAR
jgi:hypothetical protein